MSIYLPSAPRPPFSRPDDHSKDGGDPAIPPGATLLSILEQVSTPSPVPADGGRDDSHSVARLCGQYHTLLIHMSGDGFSCKLRYLKSPFLEV